MIRIRVPALAVMAAAFLLASCSGSNSVATRAGRRRTRSAMGDLDQPAQQWRHLAPLAGARAVHQRRGAAGARGHRRVGQHHHHAGREGARHVRQPPRNRAARRHRIRAGHGLPDQRARPGTHGRPRRHQALRVHGEDAGREFRCPDLRTRRRAGSQRVDGASRRRSHRGYRGAARSIEKIVTATLDGKPLAIVWTAGEHEHGFTINDIARKREEQEVVLKWDGAPLNLKNAGSQSWRIPALDEFAVTQAEAVQLNDQRQIQVHFSDALDARQDLKGLSPPVAGRVHHVASTTTCSRCTQRRRGGQSHAHARTCDPQPLGSVARRNARIRTRVHQHQAAGALRRQRRDPARRQDAQRPVRGGERARGARDGAAGVRGQHPAVPAGESLSRLAGARPRRPRVVAQDHSAHLAGAGQLDALRPGCHRAHRQTPGRAVPAHAVAGARRTRSTIAPASAETAAPEDPEPLEPGRWRHQRLLATGTTTRRSTTTAKSTGTNATIPASRRTTATDATSAPRATCSHPTSA